MRLNMTLNEHPLFAGLTPGQVDALADQACRATYRPGDMILREGETADTLFLLESGCVALELHEPGRGTIPLETLQGGEVLGLSWLQDPPIWHLDARARTDVTAIAIPASALVATMDADPAFGYAVSRRLLKAVVTRLEHVRLQRVAFEEHAAWVP